eukprot:1324258-Lingulodinium_polyedra.AAC.1
MLPLFDVRIELRAEEIAFKPAFEDEDGGGTTLRNAIDGWLKDFFAVATVMPRLDSQAGDYLNEIKEHPQMLCLLALGSELIDNTEMKCMAYRRASCGTPSSGWTPWTRPSSASAGWAARPRGGLQRGWHELPRHHGARAEWTSARPSRHRSASTARSRASGR